MTYRAGAVVNVIICNYNFLTGIVELGKSSEFPLIGFLFGH